MSEQDDPLSALTARAEQAEAKYEEAVKAWHVENDLRHDAEEEVARLKALPPGSKCDLDAEGDGCCCAECCPYCANSLRERVATLLAAKAQAEAERDAFRDEANSIRRNYLRETKELAERVDTLEASYIQLVSALREKVTAWRMKAAQVDTFHATMATGWKVCADDLDQLLAPSSAPGEGNVRKTLSRASEPSDD